VTLLAIAAFVGLLFFVWPGGAKYLFVAPLFGVALGGLAWGIAALVLERLLTLHAFGTFVLIGVAIAELLAMVDTK